MRKFMKIMGIVLLEMVVLAIAAVNSIYDSYSILNILDYIWDIDSIEFGMYVTAVILLPFYELIIHKSVKLAIEAIKDMYKK